MAGSSMARWAAVAAVVAICGLPTTSALAATSPSPAATATPTATATPVPTPTPAPEPAPSPTSAPSPTPAPSASATALPSAAPSATPSATPATPATPRPSPTLSALPAPGPAVAVLSSDAIQLTGLRSLAVRTVSRASGPVKVIELQADGSTITGLGLQGPCVGHATVDTSAARDVATGGLTLDATALQATILGVPIVIAADGLPDGALTLPGITLPTLPTDLGIVTVRLFVLSIQSGSMTLDAPRITPSAC